MRPKGSFSQSVRRPHFTTSTAWTRYGTPFPEDSLLTRSRYPLLLPSFRRSRIPRLVFPEGLNARRTARRDRERLGTARHAVGGFHIKPAAEFPSLAGRRVVIGGEGFWLHFSQPDMPATFPGRLANAARGTLALDRTLGQWHSAIVPSQRENPPRALFLPSLGTGADRYRGGDPDGVVRSGAAYLRCGAESGSTFRGRCRVRFSSISNVTTPDMRSAPYLDTRDVQEGLVT